MIDSLSISSNRTDLGSKKHESSISLQTETTLPNTNLGPYQPLCSLFFYHDTSPVTQCTSASASTQHATSMELSQSATPSKSHKVGRLCSPSKTDVRGDNESMLAGRMDSRNTLGTWCHPPNPRF
ncbi:hypothetical protein IAQ61_003857 [Plenodomus lingam]|uniref:uncharacterized protein n=1 Tax=Leptosphaeria maculans TaxID=5022 RepID=UPI0033282051|nr:hypothetical protein IAQ61_003857 [Plenodomus lingam]